MATRPKAVIESRNGEKFSPITVAKNVLTDDGQNLQDILSDRKEDMMTPTIENSSSMFKVGQGDNVDYSDNVVNGAYESCVLKGKSLVNLLVSLRLDTNPAWVRNGSSFTLNASGVLFLNYTALLKPNTTYTVVGELDFDVDGIVIGFREGNKSWETSRSIDSRGRFTELISTSAESTSNTLTVHRAVTANSDRITISNLMVLEGDWTNKELPSYFEGICDCKSPILSNVGKNISPINTYETTVWAYAQGYQGFNRVLAKNIMVDENKEYHLSFTKECEDGLPTNLGNIMVQFSSIPASSNVGDHNSVYTHCQNNKGKKYAHITMPNIGVGSNYIGKKVTLTNIQLRESSTLATYEPYQSNTTTFDQKDGKTIVLRSLPNGVCDTLNVENGEYVQRIGEVVLDGSEVWSINTFAPNNKIITFNGRIISNANVIPEVVNYTSDKTTSLPNNFWNSDEVEGFLFMNSKGLAIKIKKEVASTSEELVTYLSRNPVTVQYELATPIVKQVNVEGYPYAYENGHILLESGSQEQSLTPTIEYSIVANRGGQIRSNQRMVERHQKQLDRLQAMILTNLVNTRYEQTLTNLKYDLKNVREEVK